MERNERASSRDIANAHACKTLLNCYLRESGEHTDTGVVLDLEKKTYVVPFPHRKNGCSLEAVSGTLLYRSATGEHEYDGFRNSAGEQVDCLDLAAAIVGELRHRHPGLTNERVRELLMRIDNSRRNVVRYVEHSLAAAFATSSSDSTPTPIMNDYRTSEQCLLFGHPFHPFPKCNIGFNEEAANAYSPEIGCAFSLCYVAVENKTYRDERAIGGEEPRWLRHDGIERLASEGLGDDRDRYTVLPMHPWQYRHVLNLAAVKPLVAGGTIVPLGSGGPVAYPTSSVRTVYVPELSCNIKLPLDIQITNLRRNNSREQMRRTLDAANYLRMSGCFDDEEATFISYEDGVYGVRLQDAQIESFFTVAYRPIFFDESSTFVLASLIESPAQGGACRLFALFDRNADIREWFRRYLTISLLPLVRATYRKGIHFEAHLQNSLLTLKDGWPHAFIVRDLEGVSVERQLARPESANESPLFYEQAECRARTDYYLIVNHLGSLIHAMARDSAMDEDRLWEVARDLLEAEYDRTQNSYALYLLTAETFRAKKNLTSCLAGHGETPDYVAVSNPLKRKMPVLPGRGIAHGL